MREHPDAFVGLDLKVRVADTYEAIVRMTEPQVSWRLMPQVYDVSILGRTELWHRFAESQ